VHFSQIEQNVDVIGDPADDDKRGIKAPNHCSQIGVDTGLDLVVEKGPPILRAENQVCVHFREGLRHRRFPEIGYQGEGEYGLWPKKRCMGMVK